jgi:anti-sigma factor RsiW
MRCRAFEESLAEWIRGRLSEEEAAEMEAHRAMCPACSRAAAQERDLVARWRDLAACEAEMRPRAEDLVDCWPHLRVRLERPLPSARSSSLLRYAFCGVAAAAAALYLLTLASAPSRPAAKVSPHISLSEAGYATREEERVVRMAAEVQRLPDPEDVRVISASYYHRDEIPRLLGSEHE